MSKVALIFGATGIVGSALAEQLAKTTSPNEWKKVIITSRRAPVLDAEDERIKFVSIDLEDAEEEVKKKLLDAGAAETTHVFFTAYIHSKTWDGIELVQKNVPIFEKAVKIADAIAPNLQRILLQTGAKYYGIHLGPIANPPVREETHGRHPPAEGNPDFYFDQEDILVKYQKGKKWTYTTERPSNILGVTRGNGMSIVPTLALYFLVQKELGKKALFPGGAENYRSTCDQSNAELIAQFLIFLSTNPKAENEHFHIVDSGTKHITWEDYWKAIGKYFGVEIEEPTFEKASKSKDKREYSLEEYMKDKQPVWVSFVKKHGGDEKLWDWATWDFADALFGLAWPNGPYSMDKAKKIGWDKEVDPEQSFVGVLDKMKRLNMLPQK